MNFGEAITAVKMGRKVARYGWNGKGMYIFLETGVFPVDLEAEQQSSHYNGVSLGLFDISGSSESSIKMPCFCMRAADGSIVRGWLASQTDMFAEDWSVLDD